MAITVKNGAYSLTYDGGRLADIMLDGEAVDAIQVADYDWEKGSVTSEPTKADVQKALDEWVSESAADYERANPHWYFKKR